MSHHLAPEWKTSHWFNTPRPLSLQALRGKAIALYAFQMLCPGCVSHALPQAKRLRETFPGSELAIIGLHTVFEHHEANSPATLEAFLHEYRINFPIGIDALSAGGGIPQTMQAYAMHGTPTLILIDAKGRLHRQFFGHVPDLRLGSEIANLLQRDTMETLPLVEHDHGAACMNSEGCS